MTIKSPTRKAALLLSGAAIGAAGGYAVSASGASPAGGAHARGGEGAAQHRAARRGERAEGAKRGGNAKRGTPGRLRRAVSITAVVPTREGRFATLTIERGTLVARSGAQLTLREGSRAHTYKTVNVTLPSNATVRLSKQPSSLDALSAGDRVVVIEGPRKTAVLARPPRQSEARAPAGEQSEQGMGA